MRWGVGGGRQLSGAAKKWGAREWGVYGICSCAKGVPLSYHLDRIAPGVLSLCVPREASDPRLPVGIFVCLFVTLPPTPSFCQATLPWLTRD